MRYPTDSGLALDSARVLAREARKLSSKVGKDAGHVRDRSRAIGRRVRAITRTLGRRTGERKQQVLKLTEQAAKLVERSTHEAKRPVVAARRRARGRGAKANLRQIHKLEVFIDLAERVTNQIRKRMRGERITERLVSIFDPDARPIRKGKLGKPNLGRYRDYADMELAPAVDARDLAGLLGLGGTRCRHRHRPSRKASSLSGGL